MNQYERAREQVARACDKMREQEARGKDADKILLINMGEAFALVVIDAAENLHRVAVALERANKLNEPAIPPEPGEVAKPKFPSV